MDTRRRTYQRSAQNLAHIDTTFATMRTFSLQIHTSANRVYPPAPPNSPTPCPANPPILRQNLQTSEPYFQTPSSAVTLLFVSYLQFCTTFYNFVERFHTPNPHFSPKMNGDLPPITFPHPHFYPEKPAPSSPLFPRNNSGKRISFTSKLLIIKCLAAI
jgi:hypothetical protein